MRRDVAIVAIIRALGDSVCRVLWSPDRVRDIEVIGWGSGSADLGPEVFETADC